MSVKLVTIYWSNYDSGISKTLVRGLLQVDTLADLPGPDDITGYRLTIGTEADIIDTAARYKMDSSGAWYVQQQGTDFYTKSETDTLLAAKQDILTFDSVPSYGSDNPVKSGGIYSAITAVYSAILGPGTNISGTLETPFDLDSLRTVGCYNIATAAATAYILNKPSDTDITTVRANVIVLSFTGNRQIQIYLPNRTANSQPFADFYIRSYGSSWQSWRGFYGTQI